MLNCIIITYINKSRFRFKMKDTDWLMKIYGRKNSKVGEVVELTGKTFLPGTLSDPQVNKKRHRQPPSPRLTNTSPRCHI